MSKIDISEGKYTFIKEDSDYRVRCLRYNEEWMVFEKGCNAISALLYQYEELEAELKSANDDVEHGNEVIEDLVTENKRLNQLVFAYESTNTPVNPLLAENAKLKEEIKQAYNEGLRAYAWWKDGVQYVGSCGTTLKQALKENKNEA